jgi:hypothetical protein
MITVIITVIATSSAQFEARKRLAVKWPLDHHDFINRRKALIADLEKLAAGWTPDQTTLAAALMIEDWYVDFYPNSSDICIVGTVVGHPRLGDGIVTTSPIMAIDLRQDWARTHGRVYKLGKRAKTKMPPPRMPALAPDVPYWTKAHKGRISN